MKVQLNPGVLVALGAASLIGRGTPFAKQPLRTVVLSVLWGSGLALSPTSAAERTVTPHEPLLEVPRFTGQMLHEQVVPPLLAQLSANEQRLFTVKVADVIDDRDPLRVGVVNEQDGRHRIEISAGFIETVDNESDATAVAARKQRYGELANFAHRYADALRESVTAPESFDLNNSMQLFANFIGWDRASYASFKTSADYRSMRDAMSLQTLAWVTAHYVGHAVWEARSVNSERPALEREREIDAFAAGLTRRAGFAPRPPLVSTLVFTSLEDPDEAADEALCRALAILQNPITVSVAPQTNPLAAQYVKAEQLEVQRLRSATTCPPSDRAISELKTSRPFMTSRKMALNH